MVQRETRATTDPDPVGIIIRVINKVVFIMQLAIAVTVGEGTITVVVTAEAAASSNPRPRVFKELLWVAFKLAYWRNAAVWWLPKSGRDDGRHAKWCDGHAGR